ncbi:hypothetical protein KC332_g2655 [Hortaea werneckii]|uniref:BRCT domain-containing protein n=1 Tax=Hortaea werneckii TaxID=91943 RepID=A0A3M7J8A7_HORWE|nr:hypothetical protein KC350_g2082 [Hortaea werneckii]KAI6994099.1 hypothetical protein KC329_g2988 [Hortaea werneckii]KAI7273365.1 hypothetical protein KC335_g3381 [Hortaea werneckii]KAI7416969.1 hypothetical protein KC332_g2655 [Hortaea werneckii]KAI7453582.1 hypothetical protein KC368_g2290 [Hortaea werneckii]
MASLATESSVGSVPLNHLDAVKRQLLQTHGRPSVDAHNSADGPLVQQNDNDSSGRVDNSNAASGDAAGPVVENDEHSAVIPESHESAYRTPAHTSPAPRQVPRLSSTKSAPPAEMEAMVHQSPSQQAFKDMTRAESFHGYPGGDTQPMESQVYRDYTESMAVRSSRVDGAAETPRKTMLFLGPDGKVRETYNSAASGDGEVGKTPQTLGEGDTGYIDLANAWDGQRSQGRESATSDFDDLLKSPQETQIHVGEDGTSQQRRLALLKTPTTAGHKRNRSGDLLTSAPTTTTNANKTPGYSQLFQFGKTAPALNATQMFEQTQAPSSPVPGANGEPRSDPVTTRPSPNIRQTQNLQSSPMHVTTSSPVTTFAAGKGLPSSTAAEPRDNYTSMRASQEKRAARLRKELHAEHGLNMLQDSSDDDDWSQERRIAQRRLQRARSEQDLSTWSKIRAPSRPGSRPSSSRKANAIVDLITPATERFRKQGEKQDFEISDAETDADDVMAEAEANGEDERPTAHEDEYDGEGMEEGQESGEDAEDDVYDELGQTVLRSQADLGADGGDANEGEDEGEGAMHDENDIEDGDTAEATNPEGRSRTKPFTTSNGEPLVSSTQRSAIADSQPQQQQSQPHQPESAPPKNLSQHHSSMTSFVPGSQYAGRTSQDLATLKPSSLQRTSASQPEVGEKMPSSPPLPKAGNSHFSQPQLGETTSQDGEDASMARKDLLAQFQEKQRSIVEQNNTSEMATEIPESDVAQPITSGPDSTHHEAVQDPQSEERPVPGAPYSTARTHQSSQPSPFKPQHPRLTTQTSKTSSNDSPRKAAGVRRFAEIAADPTPPSASAVSAEGQDFDVMGLMDGVMTEEDRKFIEAVSSPPRRRAAKRREVAAGSGGDDELQGQVGKEARGAPQGAEREGQDEGSHRAGQGRVQDSESGNGEVPHQSKDCEAPLPTSDEQPRPKGTQESAREREAAGAAAASQLLSARNREVAPQRKAGEAGKAAGAHESEAAHSQPRSVAKSATVKQYGKKGVARSKRNSRAQEAEKRQEPQQPGTPALEDRHAAVETPAPVPAESSNSPDKPAEEPPLAASESAHAARKPQELLPVVAPHRIFALFKGQFNSFYPATHLSTSADAKTHRVRFEDQNLTSIDSHLTCALDLRIGDLIKVDGKGWRKDVWVIVGFDENAQTTVGGGSEGLEGVGCDVYGHTVAKVQKRSGGAAGRASLSASTGAAELKGEGQVFDVLVTNIYLTHSLWPAFAGRKLSRVEQQPLDSRGDNRRLGTPSAGLQTPDVETPGSRSRRGGTTSKVAKRTSHLREESVSSFDDVAAKNAGIFSGMAFAISFGSNEAEKLEVTRLIRRNGGLILETGFDELFEIPDLDGSRNDAAPLGRSASKNKKPVDDDNEEMNDGGDDGEGTRPLLRLKPQYQDLGFAALIADKHSRRAKYMQALALNLPTLSSRWVTDSLASASASASAATPREPSVAAKPSRSSPLPWATYLLAAGESAYLSGAIRSRPLTSPPYAASTARLREIIAQRPLLLQGDGVLIVAPAAASGGGAGGKSVSQAWERRKAYAFLTLALGAGRVRRVAGLEEVRGLLRESEQDDEAEGGEQVSGGRWKWVYVDGDVGEARVRVFGGEGGKGRGGGSAVGGKGKRKRHGSLGITDGRGEKVGDAKAMSVPSPDGRVKVVNDEFVVQSLILGALVG